MGFTLFNVVRFCLTYLSSFFFFCLLVVGCCSFAGSIYKDYDSIIIDIFGTVRLDFHLQRVDGANFYAIKCRQWGQQLTSMIRIRRPKGPEAKCVPMLRGDCSRDDSAELRNFIAIVRIETLL